MRKAIYLAAEAWRQHYGHTATHRTMTTGAKLDFELPNGEMVTLPGWSERKQVTPKNPHGIPRLRAEVLVTGRRRR